MVIKFSFSRFVFNSGIGLLMLRETSILRSKVDFSSTLVSAPPTVNLLRLRQVRHGYYTYTVKKVSDFL